MPELNHDQAKELARRYFTQKWAEAHESITLGQSDPAFDAPREIALAQAEEQRLRKLAAEGSLDSVTADAAALLTEQGFGATVALESLEGLKRAMMRARIEQRRIYAAMLSRAFDDAEPRPIENSLPLDCLGGSRGMMSW